MPHIWRRRFWARLMFVPPVFDLARSLVGLVLGFASRCKLFTCVSKCSPISLDSCCKRLCAPACVFPSKGYSCAYIASAPDPRRLVFTLWINTSFSTAFLFSRVPSIPHATFSQTCALLISIPLPPRPTRYPFHGVYSIASARLLVIRARI